MIIPQAKDLGFQQDFWRTFKSWIISISFPIEKKKGPEAQHIPIFPIHLIKLCRWDLGNRI